MATSKKITMTQDELQTLIKEAVQEALKAAKPQRQKQSPEEKEAKRAEKAAAAAQDAEGLQFVEASILPKRRPFDPRMAWNKTDPGDCLIRGYSPKDGSPQTWVATQWRPAKSGNGFVSKIRFVEPVGAPAAAPESDLEDFLKSVG